MNNPMQQHGAFSWCELTTTDPNAAKQFYQELFGWKMEDGPVQGMDYTVVSAGGQQVGGLMGMPENMPKSPPSWGAYVTVENVDATAKKVEELGGKVLMQPHDIPDVGRFAFVQDPQGATISVITYANA
jgi:uncharacterized protein